MTGGPFYITIPVNGTLLTTEKIAVDETGEFPSVTLPVCVYTFPPGNTGAFALESSLSAVGSNNTVFQFAIFNPYQKTLAVVERSTEVGKEELVLFLFYGGKAYPVDVSLECLSYVGGENMPPAVDSENTPSAPAADLDSTGGEKNLTGDFTHGGHKFMTDYFAPMINRADSYEPYKIVLGGDSITKGSQGSGYAQDGDVIIGEYRRNPNGYCWANLFKAYIEENYHATVTNNAVEGTYAQWWDARKTDLIPADADLLILTLGTNERIASEKIGLTRSEQIANFYTHVKSIIDYCHAQGTMILLCSSIPSSTSNEELRNEDGSAVYPSHVYDFNGVLSRLASEYDMDWFNLYNAIYYHYLWSGVDYDTMLVDTLHPGDELYTVMYYEYLRGFGLAPSYAP